MHRGEFEEVIKRIVDFDSRCILGKSSIEKIEVLFDKHKNDSLEEVTDSVIKLLSYTSMGAASDFAFFGNKIPRKRYLTTTECLKGTLIHQSITGLYETRTDLNKLGED